MRLESAIPANAAEQELPRVVYLQGISWASYLSLVKDVGDGAARLSYQNGYLQIELPSQGHERLKCLAGRLVENALGHFRTDYNPLGATTWQRADLQVGVEADNCYYIQSVHAIRHREEVNLAVDPPPDLALEIDQPGTVLDKLGIFAALGIPEAWLIAPDGEAHFFRLNDRRSYLPLERSIAVPVFPETCSALT